MSKPKLELVESHGYYHLMVDDYHNPRWCAECVKRGTWPVDPPKTEKPQGGKEQ